LIHFYKSVSEVNMSASRAFLASSRLLKVPTRGKALANWTRPSIDEMGVPTEAWGTVNARNNQKFLIHLIAGVGSITLAVGAFANTVFLNGTPKHLLK